MSNYNVTLKSSDDLDGFYADMENDGGSGNVPQRAVAVVNRRPISRNTEYDLDDAEATELANDSRVLAVEAMLPEGAVTIRPSWEQDGNFSKSNSLLSNNINWGIKRSLDQAQTPNWGSNNTQNIFDTVQCTASGRNVDVVIVDGFLQTDNPQLAENADGTGNSRVDQFDWGQLRNAVDGGANFNYQYTTGTANLNNGDDNHGIHVAGTVCGQTQGFARNANIFNISPYGSVTDPGSNPNATNGASGTTCYDYIREWHNNKDINPALGHRNPTIVNNSWGGSISPLVTDIVQVTFQGATTGGPFTEAQLEGFGLTNIFTDQDANRRVSFEFWSAATEADTVDAINAGIIMVGAAGNDDQLIDVPGGPNFDNEVVFTFNGGGPFAQFYHRGSANVTAGSAICVGAMGAFQTEAKADFSQCGPRIDVWAPGVNITSSLAGTDSGNPAFPFTVVQDPLNTTFLIGKLQGTSMASPQVCGILACWLEQNPRATQADCVEYLQKNSSRPDQLAAGTNGGFTDVNDLQGAPRDVLCFDFLRPSAVSPDADDVTAYPHHRFGPRADAGMLLPRRDRLQSLLEFDPADFTIGPVAAGPPEEGVAKEYHIDFAGVGDPPIRYTWSTDDAGATVTPNGGGFNGILEDNNCLFTFSATGNQTIRAVATRPGYMDLETTFVVNVIAAGTGFTLSSPDFNNGDPMPDNVGIRIPGGNFANINSPALAWDNLPAGTESLSLICFDPDGGSFIHWNVSSIPNTATGIAAQSRDTASNWPVGTVVNNNDWAGTPEEANFSCQNGWGAAAPPAGETHTYEFQLVAFDAGNQQLQQVTLQGTYTGV